MPVETVKGTCYLAYGRDPNFPPWSDSLQLNYFNVDVRHTVIAEMKKAAEYCDGFRCDMAMLLLNSVFENTWGRLLKRQGYQTPEEEFWSEVTGAIPHIIWIAEAYWDTEARLLDLGFNYVYDKGLYDRLRLSSVTDIRKHLETGFIFQKRLVRFIENHDELRSAAVFPGAKLKAVAALLATLPGMKLYYQGQLEGKRIRPPVQLGRVKDDSYNPELLTFYNRLLAITNHETFHWGKWQLKTVYPAPQGNHSENLFAYTWRLKDSLKLIVINFGESLAQGLITLSEEVEQNLPYLLTDELDGQHYRRWGNDMTLKGLHVILDGYQTHIFNVEREEADCSQ